RGLSDPVRAIREVLPVRVGRADRRLPGRVRRRRRARFQRDGGGGVFGAGDRWRGRDPRDGRQVPGSVAFELAMTSALAAATTPSAAAPTTPAAATTAPITTAAATTPATAGALLGSTTPR